MTLCRDAKNINDDNMEKVRTQFQAVVDAMQQLTAEEQKELDTSRYRKVAAVLYGPFLGVPIPIPGTDVEWMISQYEDGCLRTGRLPYQVRVQCLILKVLAIRLARGRTKSKRLKR